MPRMPKIILMIESSRASGRALLRGIADYSRHHGPWSFSWAPAGMEKVQPLLETGDADGIILRDIEQAEEIAAYGLPTVVVGHRNTEISGMVNLVTDSKAIGRLGADHLVGCGFKHFAYCGYEKSLMGNTTWSDVRREFFCHRVRAAGFENPPQFALSMQGKDWSREWRLLANWLKALSKPVGVMACNDDCGQRLMEVCKLTGLTVPDEVGVLGVDNDEVVCGLTDPPMSSIAIHFERAGYDAANALNGLMRRSRSVPPRIIAAVAHVAARRSTDFVATEDLHLAKALQFIRDQSRRRCISVNEVAGCAGLSRRMLESRFRKLLGRSVLDEIRRLRIDQIAQLLVETDLPVAQIAELLGFADRGHIARYFRAGKGISPLAYRKTYGPEQVKNGCSENGDSFPQSGVVSPMHQS
jgi:LacI family transcriptional regulator